MTGKGKHHTVPLIFPPDTVPSIQKLVDPKIRIISGVLKSNNYVFPSTRQSELSAMKVICNLLQLKNPNIITRGFGHRTRSLRIDATLLLITPVITFFLFAHRNAECLSTVIRIKQPRQVTSPETVSRFVYY